MPRVWLFPTVAERVMIMNILKAATLSNLVFTVSPSPPASVFEPGKSFKHSGTMFYVPAFIVADDSVLAVVLARNAFERFRVKCIV